MCHLIYDTSFLRIVFICYITKNDDTISTHAHTKARYSMILFINLISGSRLCVCNQYQKSFYSEIANYLPFSSSFQTFECVVRTLTSLALNLKQSEIYVARETGAKYIFKVDLQNKQIKLELSSRCGCIWICGVYYTPYFSLNFEIVVIHKELVYP